MSQTSPSQGSEEMSGVDWFMVVCCPGIGCIVGIVRAIQGKPGAGKMIGLSLLFIVLWNIVNFAIRLGMAHH